MSRWRSLTRDVRLARFVARPNRFVARCALEDGSLVDAHLPNPGRMWELLLPDVQLWLARRRFVPSRSSPPVTGFTVLAVERSGEPVMLHTHATNDVARHLIEGGQLPPLGDARVIATEVKRGRSRFDLLLSRRGKEVLCEVKSVTLFGNGTAMFPDAPTARGRRHLVELAESAAAGVKPVVLFLVHTRRVERFLPDYHTDLEFARTLLALRRRLQVVAAAVGWRPRLGLPRRAEVLPIDWRFLARHAQDRGAYLLLLRLKQRRLVEVGKLGRMAFQPGTWIYVGSAMAGLDARMARHLRRRKRLHWHVDHLRDVADEARALPIRSANRLECSLAAALGARFSRGPAGFGSSDCGCSSHLFFHPEDPLADPDLHTLLQRFRMAGAHDAG
ncbi:MAG: DNA/RNA nuclease SfsA [Deltaproteobacteria bacterium]|jgi:sugar fermentation stimulation protein A|nr:DNA/RNA nuclease SfsA [Deltaproteobacteria bacterium]MBW2534127.1 DNA/RNA nuclease SfsA [Deltaproteobacteria bacterium]